MHKPIICFDFDGVIHSYVSGWKGARNIPDHPNFGALECMEDLINQGFDVCIHSSRSGQWGGRRAMRNWLKQYAQGMWYPSPGRVGLEDVRFPLFKPPAILTIDDRAIQFKGEWPTLAFIKNFKPWKKEKPNG